MRKRPVCGTDAVVSRFLRFAMVGAVATSIQYAMLIGLVRTGWLGPAAASSLGFAVGAIANYVLNYRFTFRSRRPHGPAVARFLVLGGGGLLLNAGLMRLLVAIGWHYLFAQLCATAIVLLWNFYGNSLWTFRDRAAA